MPRRISSSGAVFVRPYDARIRDRVQRLLSSVGCSVDPREVATGTPDDEAVETVLRLGAVLLIVPFQLHRDRQGRQVDGLGLIHRLSQARPYFPWAVVMPVSRVAVPAALLRMQRDLPPAIQERVLSVYEDELDYAATRECLARHLAVVEGGLKRFGSVRRRVFEWPR